MVYKTTPPLANDLGIHPTTFQGWLRAENCPKNRDVYDKVMAQLSGLLVGKKAEPVSVSTKASPYPCAAIGP